MIMMTRLRSSKHYISFLSSDLVPITIRQSFFTDRTRMIMFQPNLKTDKAEKMTTLRQSADIKSALANNTQSFLINFILPRL